MDQSGHPTPRTREELEAALAARERECAALRRRLRRARLLYREAPAMLQFLDAAGRIEEVSRAWLETFGHRADDVLGRDFAELVAAGDVARFRHALAGLGPQGHEDEYRVLDGEGRVVEVRISAVPIDDGLGGQRGTLAALVDLRERNRAAVALARSEARLRGVLEQLSEGVALYDAEDRLVLWNPAYERFSADAGPHLVEGLRFEDLVRRVAASRVAMGVAPDEDTYIRERMAQRREAGAMLERQRPDGSAYLIREVRAPDGGTVVATVDVTELKRRERELTRSNADLEQFAYAASHDLQEPLRVIAGYVQLLEQRYADRLDDDARVFIGFAVDAARRMRVLIEDLLRYSRVGRHRAETGDVEAGEAVQGALGNLARLVDDTGARVTAGPLPRVHADPGLLLQLFQNLLANALKFRGDSPPRIEIEARAQGGAWCFRVSDNGIGIAPEHAERVFALFQRLHTRERYPGTGIGLALCRRIVEAHGGRIWLEPRPGPGTTVCFTLPPAGAGPAAAPAPAEPGHAATTLGGGR